MRITHYVIFCHSPEKQLIIVFKCYKHIGNWLASFKDYVMSIADIMNIV